MKSIKTWLAKFFFGKDVYDFMTSTVLVTHELNSHIASLQEDQTKLALALSELATVFPSSNWVTLIHNAVLGLDSRIDTINRTLQAHQKEIESISESEELFSDFDLPTTNNSN